MTSFPMTITLPILWGDQDAFGHVNNIIYLKWFESSRIAYTRQVGLLERLKDDQVGPILASSRCDYRKPLNYPDTVSVSSRVVKVGRTSLTFEHQILAQSSESIAAEGSAVLVYYDYRIAQPVPIPDSVRQAIEAFETSEGSR